MVTKYKCPVFVAGDFFHKWNSPPELINLVAKFVKSYWCYGVYAVPGQHDLPYHRYNDLEKTAYWNLVQSKVIKNLVPGTIERISVKDVMLEVEGFPWEHEITPSKGSQTCIKLCVAHSYIWQDWSNKFKGASDKKNIVAYIDRLKGYDLALFGDNHKGFLAWAEGCFVYNHGSFIRRNSDERSYKPTYGLILNNGNRTIGELKTDEDKWDVAPKMTVKGNEETTEKIEEFMTDLVTLADVSLDFGDTVRDFLKNDTVLGKGVRNILLKAVEE